MAERQTETQKRPCSRSNDLVKPSFWKLDLEKKNVFNQPNDIMDMCIYLNSYFWHGLTTFELLYGGIINNLTLFKNLDQSQNQGFRLEREDGQSHKS